MYATENEIRNAYRLLVKVWHPDRFQTDQRVKESAEAKLKAINSAYNFLTSASAERGRSRPPAHAGTNTAAREPSAKSKSASTKSPNGETSRVIIQRWNPRFRLWPTIKFLFKTAIFACVILLARYTWIAFDVHDSTSPEIARALDFGKESLLKGLEEPKRRFIDAMEQDWRRLDLRRHAPVAAALPPAALPAPSNVKNQQTEMTHAAAHATLPATIKLKPYVTVGSTRDEVLAQQGTPTASSEDKLVYGTSELYLKDGRVVGWRIDPFSSPIRVKLWPQSPVDPDQEFFTVNSSKDEVLVVQGTPTKFSEDKFEYGDSVVNFRNNRVVNWKNDPGSVPLRAR